MILTKMIYVYICILYTYIYIIDVYDDRVIMDNGMISLITGDSFKTQDLQLKLQGSHPEKYGPNYICLLFQ